MKRALIGFLVLAALAYIGFPLALAQYQSASLDPAFFESAIVAFEESDRESPPKPGGIVFVGSSSIRFWDSLEADMAPLPAVERGFGGAHMAHVLYNADRIILPYAPQAVVVYAGDNDLAKGSGKTAEDVTRDFQQLVAQLRAAQPGLPIYFITIKPSTRRWDRWPEMDRANRQIAALAQNDAHLSILDIATPMLGPTGEPPRSELFALDGLHLSDAGYQLWTEVVRAQLMPDLAAEKIEEPSSGISKTSENAEPQ